MQQAYFIFIETMNKILKLIAIPILFMFIGYGIIYIVYAPIINIALSTVKMFISDSSSHIYEPRNLIDFNPTDSINIETNNNNTLANDIETNTTTVPLSSITYPHYGDIYAVIKFSWDKEMINLYFGDDMTYLRKGAGQYIGSFIPGYGRPILIAGHNSSFFKTLQHAEIDSIITIKTSYGLYDYKISNIEIYDANDKTAYNLSNDNEQLILYTCYPFSVVFGRAPKRYFVYADLISGSNIDRMK